MPRLIITNNSNKEIRRANKTFPKKSTKETKIRESKIPIIDACKSLDWEYADPLMELDFDNINKYTSLELKEFARKAKIKNYSTMLKDELIEQLEIKKGIRPSDEELEEGDTDDDNSEEQ